MILRNLSWLTVSQLVRMVTGLLVGTWLTRTVGPEQNGLLGTAQVIGSLMAFTAELGLRQILIKELSTRSSDVGRVLGTAARLMFVWGFVCFLIACGVAWISGGAEMLVLGLILYAGLPLNAYLVILSQWDASQEAQRTAKLSILANGGAALARVVCILLGADLRWIAFTLCLEVMIAFGIAFTWAVRRGWGPDFLFWDPGIARTLLRESLPLFLAHSGTLLLLRADQMMVFQLRGPTEAGVYAAATRLSEIVYMAAPMLLMTFMPILSRSFQNDPARYARQRGWLFGVITLVSYASILGCWISGDWIVRLLYGDAFSGAEAVLMVHSLAALPYLHGELRNAVLVIERKTIWSIRCALLGLILNVGLNFWLIPVHGAVGAAWATGIAYTGVWFLSSLMVPALRPIGWQQVYGLLAPWWGWTEFRKWRAQMT